MKAGGLADVSFALPQALGALGESVQVVLPAYRSLLKQFPQASPRARLMVGNEQVVLYEVVLANTQFGLSLVAIGDLFDRLGSPYEDENQHAFGDNAYRFGMFCRAISEALNTGIWSADIIHANDWPTALLCLQARMRRQQPSVFTIHNLAYQGLFDPVLMPLLDLGPEHFTMHGIEYFGQASLIKAGIVYADRVTTVSPGYALEIQTAEYGCGLDGLLRSRVAQLTGVLNGIDDDVWNPRTDAFIKCRYDLDHLTDKQANKLTLCTRLGLSASVQSPLFGVVGRLVYQKGVDLIVGAIDRLLAVNGCLAILGSGEASLEAALRDLVQRSPGRVGLQLGYDEALAHSIEAGSDFFLMPSRYEPCGLNQLYSLRYGTPPIVRRTGGLADTVIDADEDRLRGNGFCFDEATPQGFAQALERAASCFVDSKRYQALQRVGMSGAYGWDQSARRYQQVYLSARSGS